MADGKSGKLSEQAKRKLEEASTSYSEMMEEIAPFVKPRRQRRYSTAGEWRVLRHGRLAPPMPVPRGPEVRQPQWTKTGE